jgi:hypothetical protein
MIYFYISCSAQKRPYTITKMNDNINIVHFFIKYFCDLFEESQQVRYAHTDIHVPDFSSYRRASVMDKKNSSEASSPGRKMIFVIVYGLF